MQMKIMKNVKKFDRNKVKKLLEEENKYIVDLLTTFDVPDSIEDTEHDEMYLLNNNKSKPSTGPTITDFKKTERAQTADELEERLNIIKNKMRTKKNKISERKAKRREMKKLKKNKEVKKILVSAHKSMKNEKQKGYKDENGADDLETDDKKNIKPMQAKPIFNEEGKIVFSKFDFASHPGGKVKKGRKDKEVKNPKDILRKIKENTRRIAELKEQGDEDKAKELKDDLAWQKVFDKVDGKSVRDDPSLLMKSIKKKKDIKKKSKKKWQEREQKVEADIAARQKKRQDNIDKRLKDKKKTKLKRLSKKGRVIPGFS